MSETDLERTQEPDTETEAPDAPDTSGAENEELPRLDPDPDESADRTTSAADDPSVTPEAAAEGETEEEGPSEVSS